MANIKANIKDSYLDNIGYLRQKAIELELKKLQVRNYLELLILN